MNQFVGTEDLFLSYLLSGSRVSRMVENETLNSSSAYSVFQLVSDLTSGIWSELSQPKPKVDTFRRIVQRSYLRVFDGKVNGAKDDLRLYARAALQKLVKQIDKAIPHAANTITALHLTDSRKEIELILTGKTQRSSSGGQSFFNPFGLDHDPKKCWPLPKIRGIEEWEEGRNPTATSGQN